MHLYRSSITRFWLIKNIQIFGERGHHTFYHKRDELTNGPTDACPTLKTGKSRKRLYGVGWKIHSSLLTWHYHILLYTIWHSSFGPSPLYRWEGWYNVAITVGKQMFFWDSGIRCSLSKVTKSGEEFFIEDWRSDDMILWQIHHICDYIVIHDSIMYKDNEFHFICGSTIKLHFNCVATMSMKLH